METVRRLIFVPVRKELYASTLKTRLLRDVVHEGDASVTVFSVDEHNVITAVAVSRWPKDPGSTRCKVEYRVRYDILNGRTMSPEMRIVDKAKWVDVVSRHAIPQSNTVRVCGVYTVIHYNQSAEGIATVIYTAAATIYAVREDYLDKSAA